MYKIKKIVNISIFCLFLTYLGYHALNGERGMFALWKINNEMRDLQKELETLHNERLELEHRVSLMRSDSLDLDLLEERARLILGLAKKDEKVVFKQIE